MVRLCIAGGQQFGVTGGGAAGITVEPLRRGVGGNLSGNLQITKSEAEGLVNGIDKTLTQLQASEADKVRDCLAPVRQALIANFFPGQPVITPPTPGRVSGWTVTFSANGAGGGNFANYGSKTVILPADGAIDIRPYFPPDMGGRNILVKMTATTDKLVSEPGSARRTVAFLPTPTG